MGPPYEVADHALTPTGFLSEVQAFRATMADPGLTREEKRRAYGHIVHRAAMVDPRDNGFANVGLALRDACLLWLDFESTPPH